MLYNRFLKKRKKERLLKEVHKVPCYSRFKSIEKALKVSNRVVYIIEPENCFIVGGIYVWNPDKIELLYYGPMCTSYKNIENVHIIDSAYKMYKEMGIKENLKWGFIPSDLPTMFQIGIFDKNYGVWFESCYPCERCKEIDAFLSRIHKYV